MTTIDDAWLGAANRFLEKPGASQHNLIAVIDDFDDENQPIRGNLHTHLDQALAKRGLPSTATTARTIFPFSYSAVKKAPSRNSLYERYGKAIPLIRKHPLNRNGVYFERMILFPSFDAPAKQRANQLENLLRYWENKGRRKSAFQVCIYRPDKDWTKQPYGKFPCMQHVVFTPIGAQLHLSAFYATQYLIKRGYGNYLGLCNLGSFMAHEMKLSLGSVTCFAAHAPLEGTKKKLSALLKEIGIE